MGAKQVMVFPFTVPMDGGGQMRDPAQGVYARSLARTLAERLSLGPGVSATAATLTADGLDGKPQDQVWVVASHAWTLEEACAIGLPEGTEYLLHGAAELTDRVRLRLILVDQKERLLSLALDFTLGGAGPSSAARAGCEKLLQLDPTAVKAHAALAEMDLAAGRPAEAAERLQKALRIRSDWWPAFERLGTALVRLGKNAEAIPWFEKALAERPEDPDALTGLGVALAETGRLEEAVQAWGRALRSGEGGAHLHQNLARVLRQLGRRGEARRHAAIARRLLGRGGFFGYLQDAWDKLTGARV